MKGQAKWSKKRWGLVAAAVFIAILIAVAIVVAVARNDYNNAPPTISFDNALAASIVINNNVSSYTVTGTVDSHKAVTFTIDGKKLPLNAHHKFSYKVSGLKEGDNFFTVVANNGSGEDRELLDVYRTTKADLAQEQADQQQSPANSATQKTTSTSTPAPKPKANTGPAKYEVYPQGGSPTTDATVWANDGAAIVVNPADLRLYGEVKNTGGKSGTPQCTIQAHDDSYSYVGTDIVTRTSPLHPGGVWDWRDDITITSQGAQYITKIEVTCQNN